MTEAPSRKGIGGPKTEEGKKRSSLNAIKHGLHVKSEHGLEEIGRITGVEFMDFVQQMSRHYQPEDPVEQTLVRRIARCAWRIHMSERMEDHQLNRRGWHPSIADSRAKLIRAERLMDIQLSRSIEMLYRKRALESKKRQYELPEPPYPRSRPRPDEREFLLPQSELKQG